MLNKISTALAMAALGASATANAGWSQDALNKQYQLQKHTPIVASNIIGTHNSYSSNAYDMDLYENQDLSITEQLEQGSRFLELDLWRNTDVEYVSVILCHNGGRCDIGAGGIFEIFLPDDFIYLDTAFVEIAKWAKQNRDQVVVIKLEDQMGDDEYHYFEEAIQRTIADIVYRPNRSNATDACESFPANTSAEDMLDQGKQIIFTGFSGAACNEIGRSWVFKGTNTERDSGGYKDYGDEYRACSTHGDGRYALFFDSAAEGEPGNPGVMPDSAVRPLMKCGGTVLGFDWLQLNDNRIAEAVWSWAPNQPDLLPGSGAATNVDCAVSYNGRFYDDNCGFSFAYACSDGANWKVTNAAGVAANGEAVCQTEFGADYHYDVPRTSKQNQLAEAAKTAAGKSAFWLNYADSAEEGVWLSGADVTHAATLSVNSGLKVQSWNDYKWVYSDAGTGGDNNISIWRANNLPTGWYSLGDVAGLATSGSKAYKYSREPGSSLVALDDGSGKLAKPVSYSWRWNDWKTGGDTDVTFWHPVAPAGYTCLGSIAIPIDSRTQPSTDLMRCVRNDQLIQSEALWEWSDAGSGGEYGATIYLNSYFNGAAVPAGATANTGLSANTYLVNTIVADQYRVLDSRVVNWNNGPKSVITGDIGEQAVSGNWISSGGRSATATGNPNFVLTVIENSSVEINLTSGTDTYLYLKNASGSVIATNDDGGAGYNSKIVKTLSAGSYTAVAATYSANASNSFQMSTSKGGLKKVAEASKFTHTPDAAISGYNNESLSSVSVEQCAAACLANSRTSWCVSFDYSKNHNSCDLSSKRASDIGGLKTNYSGNPYDHYSLK